MKNKVSNALILLLVLGFIGIIYVMSMVDEQEVQKTQSEVIYGGLSMLMEINEFPEEDYTLIDDQKDYLYESLDGYTKVMFKGYPDAIDEYRLVQIQSKSEDLTLFGARVGMDKTTGLMHLNEAFNVNFETDHFKYENKSFLVEGIFEKELLVELRITYFTTDKSNIYK